MLATRIKDLYSNFMKMMVKTIILRAMGAKHSNEMVGKSDVMYTSYGSTTRPPFVEVEYVYKFCQEYKNAII